MKGKRDLLAINFCVFWEVEEEDFQHVVGFLIHSARAKVEGAEELVLANFHFGRVDPWLFAFWPDFWIQINGGKVDFSPLLIAMKHGRMVPSGHACVL